MLRFSRQLLLAAAPRSLLLSRSCRISRLSLIGQLDTANIVSLARQTQVPLSTISEKLSVFTFSHMYEFLDEFTREILFYFADDLGTGVGWGIIILTCLSRIPFAINQMKILASSMKFEAKTEEVSAIQEKMKMASRSRDMEMHKILMQRMNNLRRMSGLRTSRMMVSMLQIPLAITLFMSLRHVLVLPEVFPGIKTQGFLWFKDLTVLDPYFILPIISAFLSYWSISLSTMRAPGQAMQSFYVTVLRQYARFFPILGLPIMMWFSAGMNIYFCSVSANILLVALLTRSEFAKRFFGVTQDPNANQQKLVRAYVIEQPKSKSKDSKIESGPSEPKTEAKPQKKQQDPALSGNRVEVLQHKPHKKPKK